ncbi:MAG: YhfC family intramembrane metalloprotease, partial [Anaerolineales bacterium]|nr:YhfC family intramembrane metalloprotease [Anaerolineales bacterium]
MTIFFYIITITLMILLPISLTIVLRRHAVVPWWLFVVGMGTFVGSQLYHIPLNNWLTDLGIIGPVVKTDPHFLQTAVLLGLSAGTCETLARAIGYGFLFRRKAAAHWEDGIMVGLGHGGIEAMGLIAILTAASISSLWAMRGMDLSTLNLNQEQLDALTTQLAALDQTTWTALLPFVERILAVTLHVVLSLLVWTAFQRRNPLYGIAALLYHSLFDFTAVYLAQFTQVGWLY